MRAAGLQPLLRQSHFSEWHEPTAEANANWCGRQGCCNAGRRAREEARIEEVE